MVIPPVKPRSAPGVAPVLDVVVLQVALIFDLVDQDLGQEDANQLGGRVRGETAGEANCKLLED